jgi:hypothetical protein
MDFGKQEMSSTTYTSHPSYGCAVVVNSCGGSGDLFMSGVKHDNRVTLEIRHAQMIRSLGHASTLPGDAIVRVDFSELQWGQLMSRLGRGQGTPCTITRIGLQSVESCPADRTFNSFAEETKEQTAKALKTLVSLSRKVSGYRKETQNKSSIGKKDLLTFLETLESEMSSACNQVQHSLPFVATAIQEHAEGIVEDAKCVIAAFAEQKAAELGLKTTQVLDLLEGDSKS